MLERATLKRNERNSESLHDEQSVNNRNELTRYSGLRQRAARPGVVPASLSCLQAVSQMITGRRLLGR
jgi:hypothetical protein